MKRHRNAQRRRHRSRHLERQLDGYRLTTAEIIYRLPDYQQLLQSYIWQEYDIAPKFPELTRFLDFWQKNLDGPIHQVRVASKQLIRPAKLKLVGGELHIH
jgi:uncharacterized protein Usg